jgi:hypothetical protein
VLLGRLDSKKVNPERVTPTNRAEEQDQRRERTILTDEQGRRSTAVDRLAARWSSTEPARLLLSESRRTRGGQEEERCGIHLQQGV